MNELRRITVHVIEPAPGRFKWVLSEVGPASDALTQLEMASRFASTYRKAMADGLAKLQSSIPDLDAGPRNTAGSTPEPEAGKNSVLSDKHAPALPTKAAPKKRGFFGFGPVQ